MMYEIRNTWAEEKRRKGEIFFSLWRKFSGQIEDRRIFDLVIIRSSCKVAWRLKISFVEVLSSRPSSFYFLIEIYIMEKIFKGEEAKNDR